jgi:hypothetical protein
MKRKDFDELGTLLQDALMIYADTDDSEVGPEREKDVDRIYELLDKIQIEE